MDKKKDNIIPFPGKKHQRGEVIDLRPHLTADSEPSVGFSGFQNMAIYKLGAVLSVSLMALAGTVFLNSTNQKESVLAYLAKESKSDRSIASIDDLEKYRQWEQNTARQIASTPTKNIVSGQSPSSLDHIISHWGANYRVVSNQSGTQLLSIHLVNDKDSFTQSFSEKYEGAVTLADPVESFLRNKMYIQVLPDFDNYMEVAIYENLPPEFSLRSMILLRDSAQVGYIGFYYWKNKIIRIKINEQ